MNKHIYILVTLITLLLFESCTKKVGEKTPDNVFYTCSMDPQVMEKKPGKCPICKMDLTKVIIDPHQQQNSLRLSEEQIELANIKTSIITETELSREKVLNAQLVVNENKRFKISSRVTGRIEHLYIKNSGEVIKAGSILYDIYSEELQAAQKEYLIAVLQAKQFSDSGNRFIQLADGAKNKLLLWGMTEAQIEALANNKQEMKPTVSIYSKQGGVVTNVSIMEGDYVMDGDPLFDIADLSTLWAEAELYSTEAGTLENNEPVTIRVEGFSEKTWNSRISFAAPQLEVQSKINLIRAEISNINMKLKPGMQATLLLRETPRKTLVLPLNALLQDSKGATVWIKKKDGSYESRRVVIGIESNDIIEIRSGVELGEEVVISGGYLLNSEYIFRRGSNPTEDHNMPKM